MQINTSNKNNNKSVTEQYFYVSAFISDYWDKITQPSCLKKAEFI